MVKTQSGLEQSSQGLVEICYDEGNRKILECYDDHRKFWKYGDECQVCINTIDQDDVVKQEKNGVRCLYITEAKYQQVLEAAKNYKIETQKPAKKSNKKITCLECSMRQAGSDGLCALCRSDDQ